MIKQTEYLEINGARQFLSIRSGGEGLPLLLYLHGGPGDAALPLVNKYNGRLEDKFTVAVWEQRGAGKSYYPFSKSEPPVIETFIEDAYRIVTWLLERFHQEKLYLVGHSWGSVLGLKFIRKYPQLVHTYVGCGQVVDMRRGAQLQYDFVCRECEKRNDRRVRSRLSNIDISYTDGDWLRDLLFVTRQVVKYGGSLYGKTSYNSLVRDFVLSPEYGLRDLLNRDKGGMQSVKFLWPELMTVSFLDVTEFKVPVVFVEGRWDHHVSSALAKEYFDTITSPKQFCWFEKSCHFPQWSEADHFYRVMNSL